MTNTSNTRIRYIDVLKGVAIIAVIVGHFSPFVFLNRIIYSFHLPIFFLICGYFIKPTVQHEFQKKILKRYMLPYVITATCIILYLSISKSFNSQVSFLKTMFEEILTACYALPSISITNTLWQTSNIGAIWFLVALCISEQEIQLCFKMHNRLISSLIILSGAVIGFSVGKIIWLPFDICNALVVSIYIWIGFLIKQYNLLNRQILSWQYLLMALCWLATLLFSNVNLATNNYPLGGLEIPGTLGASYFIMLLCQWIDRILPTTAAIISNFGSKTIYLLCVHSFDLKCLDMSSIKDALPISMNNIFGLSLIGVLRIIAEFIIAYLLYFVVISIKKNLYRTGSSDNRDAK